MYRKLNKKFEKDKNKPPTVLEPLCQNVIEKIEGHEAASTSANTATIL